MASTPPPLESIDSQNDNQSSDQVVTTASQFKCLQCGAKLTYAPGTESLKCSYCDFQNEIPRGEADIKELDFHQFLKNNPAQQLTEERLVVKCGSCAAELTSAANVISQKCPFCDTEIVTSAKSVKLLKPRSLLPFKITQKIAEKSYKNWLQGLWFAPNALKQKAKLDISLSGMYVPHWTYDSDTMSYYTGQRGIYYYVSERRTRTNSQGKQESYTTQVRHTRWHSVAGTVTNDFDDVLIVASKSLPEKYAKELAPWDLENLLEYKDDYLSGFKAESYQVDLEQGFELAKNVMDGVIRESIRSHIGGDEQRISSVKTQHNKITFKHILLPVWLSAYRYNQKIYRFMVNARTGEVQGERPWSWLKIFLTVVAVGSLFVAGYLGYEYFHQLK